MSEANYIPEQTRVATQRDTGSARDAAPTDPTARFEEAKRLAKAKGTSVTEYADASTALERPASRDLFSSARSAGFGSLDSYRTELLGQDDSDII